MRHALSDSEWRIIRPILPRKTQGIPRVSVALGNPAVAHRLGVQVRKYGVRGALPLRRRNLTSSVAKPRSRTARAGVR